MVSFKSAAHISPESSASTVRAHEQEHVSNAFSSASQDGGEVVSVSVSMHTAICPECGRSYMSGGTTKTQIKYVNEDNKYQQELKSQDKDRLTGLFFDEAV
jgi:NMD protein affecting ribosome stability and mRNA decay